MLADYLHQFLFGIYPYLCAAVFLIRRTEPASIASTRRLGNDGCAINAPAATTAAARPRRYGIPHYVPVRYTRIQ